MNTAGQPSQQTDVTHASATSAAAQQADQAHAAPNSESHTPASRSKPRRRRWTQFSIRALLLLMLLAACGTWWYSTERKKAARQERAVAALNKLGERGIVTLDYSYEFDKDGFHNSKATSPGDHPWQRALFGDAYVDKPQRLEINVDELSVSDLTPLADLPSLDNVTVISSQQREPGAIAVLGQLPELRAATIRGGMLSDADVLTWGNLPELEELTCFAKGGQLTQPAVSALFQNKPKLQQASLSSVEFAPGALSKLEPLPKLQLLFFNTCKFADQNFSGLRGMELTALEMSWCNLQDAGLAHVREMVSLTKVNLLHTEITDDGLAHLSGLSNLTTLSLSSPAITGRGLEHLASLPRLANLHLRSTTGNGEGFSHLARIPHLQSLLLFETAVTAEGLTQLAGSQSLENIVLSDCELSADHFAGLAQIPHLKQLEISNGKLLGDDLSALQAAKELKTLTLKDTNVTDAAIVSLIGCSIEILELPPTVTPAAIPSLVQITSLKNLGVPDSFSKADLAKLKAGLPGCNVY